MLLIAREFGSTILNQLRGQNRGFARMTGRAGKLQHFRYGVAKVRGRWYYRYHKPIGRANWKGYQERYLKPKDVEAKQRLVFAPKATTKQLKQSLSWQWRLPRMLAAATTPNQVLDAWVLFRYRHPKKIYHYMMTLKRLVEVGGCEPTDWRLKVLLHRMRAGYKRVVGIDVLTKYLSQLRLVEELEYLTRFIRPRLATLDPRQLTNILSSFAACHLRDTKVTGHILRRLRSTSMNGLSVIDKIKVIDSLGAVGIKNSVFVSELVSEILAEESKLELSDFAHLLKALGRCRIRDHAVVELASDKAQASVRENPINVVNIAVELAKIGFADRSLTSSIYNTASPFDVPTRYLVKFLDSTPTSVMQDNAPRFSDWLHAASESIILIQRPTDLLRLSTVLDRVQHDLVVEKEVWQKIADQYMNLEPCVQRFNVSQMARIFHKRGILDQRVWSKLYRDLEYSIPNFDPEDLIKVARVVHSVPENVIESKSSVANLITEWSLRRQAEFNPSEWSALKKFTHGCGENYRQMLDSISM
jgi:hypothetical protein